MTEPDRTFADCENASHRFGGRWRALFSVGAKTTGFFEGEETLFYGDIALDIAADLLIADSERRCAAVLLRLSGRRFADPDDPEPVDVTITQHDLAGAANLAG